MHPTMRERAALCDLFDEVGPDVPTLCEGWSTRDLAAHLRVREHRPDAGPGLLGRGPFAGYTERLQTRAARRPFAELVAELRDGPPKRWVGHWVRNADLAEWFVHHEDVRRANGRRPREDDELDDALWGVLRFSGRALTRKAQVGVELVTHDGRRRTAKAGEPSVTLTGRPSELVLAVFGRPSEVVVEGTDEAVAAWHRSEVGL